LNGVPVTPIQHTGELIATLTNWHVLVTEFLPGVTRATTLEARQSVAEVLSDLHSRSAALRSMDLQRLPWSWWAPLSDSITRAQHLFTGLNTVPAAWADFIIACQAALHQSYELQTLPETIIHGDCWMGNAVTSPASPTVLIDWEYAGQGIALLDLGNLLSDCLNPQEAAAEMDDMRIKAVMDGYQRFRTLSTNEANALAIAIRFGIAFRTAIRCHLAQQFGWIGGVQRGLAHEQARFALSERMAQAARQYIKP
jgi:Ser/Thr protein kinase RdoA (MazF antagonist)